MSVEFELEGSAVREKYRELGHGIKILHDPLNPDARIDIVAVPGLGTDPIESWTYRKGSGNNGEATSADDQTNHGNNSRRKGFNWIRDHDGITQLFPDARIMLYQYASAWTGKYKVRATMKDICEFLLEELNEKRKDCAMRPLIFIGHSMGGIVIAKALVIARAKKEYEATLTCTMGCAFFGAPFRGSNMAQLALLYSAVLGNDAYEALLSFLKEENNDVLDELTSNFVELSRKVNPPMEIICVWEKAPTSVSYTDRALKNMPLLLQHRLFKTGAEKLMEVGIAALGGSTHFVSKESACLMGTHLIGMNAGHADLVQFESIETPKFQQIRTQLSKLVVQAKLNGRKRVVLAGQNLSSQAFIKTVQRSLEGVDMRLKYRIMIKNLQSDSWLTKEKLYKVWYKHGPRTPSHLWLTGSAGRGKTNACLTVIQDLDKEINEKGTQDNSNQTDKFLAYFLCEKSTGCNTAEELLKSLITQLISQETSLAQHAKWFVSNVRSTTSGKSQETNVTKATATVENLWKCLQDIMEDPVVYRVHIIISNLHCLEMTESTHALLTKLLEQTSQRNRAQDTGQSMKWLITSRNDEQFTNLFESGQISVIDLDNAEFSAKIKAALETQAKEAVLKLEKTKSYSKGVTLYVNETLKSHLEETWIEVVSVLLEAKPLDSRDVDLRNWLKMIQRYDMDKLVDHAWDNILEANSKNVDVLVDLMQVLTIIYEPPTIADLTVLIDDTDYKRIVELVNMCSPLLRVEVNADAKVMVLFSNVEFRRRLRDRCHAGGKAEERRRHGLIVFNCFQYISQFYSNSASGSSTSGQIVSVLSRSKTIKATDNKTTLVLTSKDDDDKKTSKRASRDLSLVDTAPATYPVKYLFRHLSVASPDVVRSLCEIDENFWGEKSALRDRWLKDFRQVTPSLNDVVPEGMTAIHVAAGIGAADLVEQLIDNNSKESLAWTNIADMTALHVAAYNNHLDVVQTLIRLGSDIEAGHNGAGTPLHWAALRGNSAIMDRLIARGANVNAYSETDGPVINAAIRSGTVDAVKKVMTSDIKFDSDYTQCEPPLSLSAGYSKPDLFRDILESGKDKWLNNVKLIDRALIEAATSGHLESVKILLAFERTYTNDILEDAIASAARGLNWAPADLLLDFAIADTSRRVLRLEEVFYLAAAGRDERLELLTKLWNYLGRDNLKQNVLDFSLYEAVAFRKPQTALLLLETCGADANTIYERPSIKFIKPEYTHVASSVDYRTILNAAASTGNPLIVRALIEAGAKLDGEGCYALQLAAAEGHHDAVEMLLNKGAKIDRKVKDSSEVGFYSGTALQAACDNSRESVVRLLISRGVDPNIGGGPFSNPITSATQKGHGEILRLLCSSRKIDVNVIGTEDKSTPLIHAAEYMDIKAMVLLLEKRARVNDVNAAGDTALIKAALTGKEDCVKLLCESGANVIHESPTRGVPAIVAADALHPGCARILSKIMVATIKKYSAKEPKLERQLAESRDELKDIHDHYADLQQLTDNLKRERDQHKDNNERLHKDNKVDQERLINKGAETQAIRLQLAAKDNDIYNITQQLDRANSTIEEKQKLLEIEQATTDTLRNRVGWKDMQQARDDAIAECKLLKLEIDKSYHEIEEIEVAKQAALTEASNLETALQVARIDAKEEKTAREIREQALTAAQDKHEALVAEHKKLQEDHARAAAAFGLRTIESHARSQAVASSSYTRQPASEPIDEYQVVSPGAAAEISHRGSPIANDTRANNGKAPSGPRPSNYQRHSVSRFRHLNGDTRGDGSIGRYRTPSETNLSNSPQSPHRVPTSESLQSNSSQGDRG